MGSLRPSHIGDRDQEFGASDEHVRSLIFQVIGHSWGYPFRPAPGRLTVLQIKLQCYPTNEFRLQ